MKTIEITKAVETIDNWGNIKTYKGKELENLIQNSEMWSDDFIFYSEFIRVCYYIDDLIGKTVKVGKKTFTVKE
jgi:hypothetical protein